MLSNQFTQLGQVLPLQSKQLETEPAGHPPHPEGSFDDLLARETDGNEFLNPAATEAPSLGQTTDQLPTVQTATNSARRDESEELRQKDGLDPTGESSDAGISAVEHGPAGPLVNRPTEATADQSRVAFSAAEPAVDATVAPAATLPAVHEPPREASAKESSVPARSESYHSSETTVIPQPSSRAPSSPNQGAEEQQGQVAQSAEQPTEDPKQSPTRQVSEAPVPAWATTEWSPPAESPDAETRSAAARQTPPASSAVHEPASIATNPNAKLLDAVRGDTVEMTLETPGLGTVWLQIKETHAVIDAHLETTADHAMNLLRNELAQMRDHVESAGLNLGDLSLGYRGASTDDRQRPFSRGLPHSVRGETTTRSTAASIWMGQVNVLA